MPDRRTILGVALLVLSAGPALAKEHWLVGRWSGRSSGGRCAGFQLLEIEIWSVGPDGAVSGRWGHREMPMTLRDGTVTMEFPPPSSCGGPRYEIRRGGSPDELRVTRSGGNFETFTFTMTRR